MKRGLVTVLLLLAIQTIFSQSLIIKPLTGNLYVFTTHVAYDGEPYPSNSMYMVTDAGVVLFDTPWDTTQFQPLLDSIKARHNKDVIFCIATHFHDDRTAGFDYYASKGIATWSSKKTWDSCATRKKPQARHYFINDTVFHFGKSGFTAFYPGPGHTNDNIVAWVEKEKVLFGGCFVKSTETTDLGNIADAGLNEWDNSIRRVMKRFPKPKYIIPGHLSWDNVKSLEHTRKLLKEYAAKNNSPKTKS
jgi:glyoxylase-like metal-dependent hydrolase (beta-lactamase superfamily II)